MPARIEACIPGTESRYKVSWLAIQSVSEISTAFPCRVVICIGGSVNRSIRRQNRARAFVAVIVFIFKNVRVKAGIIKK